MHADVSRAYFHAKAQRLVQVKVPVEDCSGQEKGKIELLKKNMCGTRDAANGNETGRGTQKIGDAIWGAVQEVCSTTRKENLVFDTRRRLCGDRFEGESVGTQEAAAERVPKQSEHHRGRFGKEYQSAESENMLGRDRDIVST